MTLICRVNRISKSQSEALLGRIPTWLQLLSRKTGDASKGVGRFHVGALDLHTHEIRASPRNETEDGNYLCIQGTFLI